jgi:hypothetical protein
MKSTIFITMLMSIVGCHTMHHSSAYGQEKQEAKEESKARPKKPPVDVAELIFNRMDSNRNGSLSLKEFKAAFPRLRYGSAGGSRGRTRGFDGKTPSFRPEGSSRSRGRSRSSRGSRGRSK